MIRFLFFAGLVWSIGLLSSARGDEGKKKGQPDFEAMFKKLDTNGDGKLSKEEFAQLAPIVKNILEVLLEGKGGDPATRENFDKVFEMLDTDKDGFLSLEEFKKMMEVFEKNLGKGRKPEGK